MLFALFATVVVAAPAELSVLFPSAERDRVETDLRRLTGHDPVEGVAIRSRSIHHPQIDVAATWLQEQLAGIDGVTVRTETFEADGESGLFNIVGEMPGTEPLPWVVVGAHYDSTANLDAAWTDPSVQEAPGADDDASGVAVVLEIARLLSVGTYRHPVRFILFSAEEVGLVGAYHHVDGVVGAGEDVEVAIILDPVGYDPGGAGYLWFSYDDRWADGADAIESFALEVAPDALQVVGMDAALIGGDARSDHYPFWLAGFEAVHFGTFPQPPSYHTMGDDLDVVDLDFVRNVAGFGAAYTAYRADPVVGSVQSGDPSTGACACQAGPAVGWGWGWLLAAWAVRRRRFDG